MLIVLVFQPFCQFEKLQKMNLGIKIYEIMPSSAAWMNLEIFILGEVSQKKLNVIWYHFMWNPFFLKESYDKPRQCIKKQRHHFANKDLNNQSYGSSSSHVPIWELDHKEGWIPKNWCFWIVVLEKTLESPLHSEEIKPVNPEGNQPRIFIGRTDA